MKLTLKVRCALLALVLAASGHTADRGAQTRPSQRVLTDLTDNVNAMTFAPDGRLLAIARGARDDYRVDIWDTETGTLQRTIRGFDGPVSSVSFSPDGRTFVTGSTGVHRDELVKARRKVPSSRFFTELKWWDSQTGEFKQRFEIPEEELSAILVVAGPLSVTATYSPDGKFLAAIDHRYEVMLMYETHPQVDSTRIRPPDPSRRSSNPVRPTTLRGAVLFASKKHSALVGAIAFSTDGKLMATGSDDRSAIIWETGSGKARHTLRHHDFTVTSLAFSPSADLLAAGSGNASVVLWDVATGKLNRMMR